MIQTGNNTKLTKQKQEERPGCKIKPAKAD